MAQLWRRISFPRLLLVSLVVVLAVVLVYGGLTSSTVFGAYNPGWEGTSELRGLGDSQVSETVVLQETNGYNSVNASDAVAFVLSPETDYTTTESDRIEQFVQAGGTLVVADDFGTVSNDLLAGIGAEARFDGGLLRDERFNDGSPELPVAGNVSTHPYTNGTSQLTLNRATAVQANESMVLVTTSNYTYLDVDLDGELDDSEEMERRPVATVESLGQGDVVVVSDPSVFINAMLDREDNERFARNLVRDHETVVLDVSHASSVPPLVSVRLLLERSAGLQILIGFSLVFAVAFRRQLSRVATATVDGLRPARPNTQNFAADPGAVRVWVAERHPEWDRERVRRVTKAIMDGRGKGGSND